MAEDQEKGRKEAGRKELGETMGFDEPQKRFATRLVTGEALVYGDDFAEATLIHVRPELVGQQPVPLDLVAVAPASLVALHVARLDQLGDDALHCPLRDAHAPGDVSDTRIRGASNHDQHQPVVGQKPPVTASQPLSVQWLILRG